jgi:hypothetical protein
MNIGIVYRIFYGELNYIGSTTNLKRRMNNHINDYKNNIGFCYSKKIMCFDDYEVEVLAEIYYVENHLDINLRNLEREYMEQYVCVNKHRAIISKEESKEYSKQHYLKNKDKFKKYQKEYQQEYKLKNSDKNKEYQKEYNLKNSDKIKEYNKQYYLTKNKNLN